MTTTHGDRWFLSFDCATKSLAFALVRLRDPAAAVREAVAALGRLGPGPKTEALAAVVAGLARATREAFHVAGGGATDLCPGVKNAQIPTVARVRALKKYLQGPVAAALGAAGVEAGPRLSVLVEFQLGANAPARTVAAALVMHYAEADVCLVGPALKNKVDVFGGPELQHYHFVEKYSSLYYANKQHTKAMYFGYLLPLFGHSPPLIPPGMKGDYADAIMQVLGFLQHKPGKSAKKHNEYF